MKIGDYIITKGGEIYSIDKFISIGNESGLHLISVNDSKKNFQVVQAYLNFYLHSGIFIFKKNNPVKKLKKRKCLIKKGNIDNDRYSYHNN